MRGLTLMELIVAMAISSILLFSIGTFIVTVIQTQQGIIETHSLMSRTDIATQVFREYVSQAQAINLLSSSALTVSIENAAGIEEAYSFYYYMDNGIGKLLYTRPNLAQPLELVSGVQTVTFTPLDSGPSGIRTIQITIEILSEDQVVTRVASVCAWNIEKG